MKNSQIEVRDLSESDIDALADYWLNSEKDFLIGMGVDVAKLPSKEILEKSLRNQISSPDNKKSSFALILEVNNIAVGHCNVNPIDYGNEATMHLHIWNGEKRLKGLGSTMVLKSIPIFFDRLKINTLWCEPYADNPAPNKTLQKVGFEFIKRYVTTPGSLNFEQEVNRYRLTKKMLEENELFRSQL